ncbi:hypothetical protein R1sor_015650 [Riccia sorocarpa]|uniref:Xaa-Pro aminopeptidase n=1 Tax=Riccia sorocarpa TaxID=122646 RepID=A0ABD3HEM7_9MARC
MGEVKADPLDLIRPLMAKYSPALDALVVPSEDYHQSEYTAEWDMRRQFVSGFTGSAGVAVITDKEALLWTDGRYFLQATQQLSDKWKLMRIGEDPALEQWLADNLEENASIGVDPWCISVDTANRWDQVMAKKSQKIVQLKHNLVDAVWENRPAAKIAPVIVHPVEYTGRSAKEKITDLRASLLKENASAIIVSTLDEVAWLYNLRGGDVSYNPVVHAFAIVTHKHASLYVDKRKIDSQVEAYLAENDIVLHDYDLEALLRDVEGLATFASEKGADNGHGSNNGTSQENGGSANVSQNEKESSRRITAPLIWVDPATCSFVLYAKLPADKVFLQQSPLALAKALKHPVELEGLRRCHVRDGAAVVEFTAWLDTQMQEIYGAPGFFSDAKDSLKRKRSEEEKLTEVSVSDKLEQFRSEQELFRGLSFSTISGVGSNGAIIHYKAERESCAEMQPDSMYLCDSGGQYADGTTDITRTMHFGKPTAHEKVCNTQVLKGHIALDTAIFPNGTTGHALDILARVPLWTEGLDYRHGTGHGVGSYLNVHEGPHLISFRPQARNVALQATMTVTNEPGYYEDGNFGVRIENVMIVKDAQTKFNFGDKGYLSFEHVTWVPYQTKLIDLSLLTESEKNWVDLYHKECREKLKDHLSGSTLEWLINATEPLPR